jgi:hypothetical protein
MLRGAGVKPLLLPARSPNLTGSCALAKGICGVPSASTSSTTTVSGTCGPGFPEGTNIA